MVNDRLRWKRWRNRGVTGADFVAFLISIEVLSGKSDAELSPNDFRPSKGRELSKPGYLGEIAPEAAADVAV